MTDISHQLKTPIASLKTCFALSLEADTAEDRNEFQQRSSAQIDHLDDLVSSLANISRMEKAMITLRPQLTGLQEILISAFEAVYDKTESRNISVSLDVPDDIVLTLDAHWTKQAIVNVLDNAIKYSPGNTDIQIRAEKFISFVRVEIQDEGIGIPTDERPRIFQRFFRGANPVVRASEGSGVGLSLSRIILEEQGGSISVRAGLRGGSIFIIQLRI